MQPVYNNKSTSCINDIDSFNSLHIIRRYLNELYHVKNTIFTNFIMSISIMKAKLFLLSSILFVSSSIINKQKRKKKKAIIHYSILKVSKLKILSILPSCKIISFIRRVVSRLHIGLDQGENGKRKIIRKKKQETRTPKTEESSVIKIIIMSMSLRFVGVLRIFSSWSLLYVCRDDY